MTFPGAHAEIYRNEDGEVTGWDNGSYDEPYEPDWEDDWYDWDEDDLEDDLADEWVCDCEECNR